MLSQHVLEMRNIVKEYFGNRVLKGVSLTVDEGEIHSLIGENGAGKSTLMKIIAGVLAPDEGELRFDGRPLELSGPREARQRGVSIVYQEPVFFPELSVLENFFLGEEIVKASGALDWSAMTEAASGALRRMGLSPDLSRRPMKELSIGTQQLVLIARGIYREASLLILDEPTSILSQAETDLLFRTIAELKVGGVSVLYISHRFQELFEIADSVSVLRDGVHVADMAIDDVTEEKLIAAMSGREIERSVYRSGREEGQSPLLEVKGLWRAGCFQDVSFHLCPGEILGLYGLVGAGRSEVAQCVVEELPRERGEVLLEGRPFRPGGSRKAQERGVVYVPEDRGRQGLFPIRSIRDNLSAGLLRQVSSWLGVVDRNGEERLAQDQVEALKIKVGGLALPVSSLSGGNQQKVLLARGLLHRPRVLILDEPTRGIDVGTKAEIHRLIMDLAREGVAVLLISSDLPEMLALADRVAVMHEGELMASLDREEATEEAVLRLAIGLGEGTGTEG